MHIRKVVKIENSRAILECGHGKPAQGLEQGQETDCATCLFDPEAHLKFDQAHVKKMRSPIEAVRKKAIKQRLTQLRNPRGW